MTEEADLNNENNTDSERENIIKAYRSGEFDFTESNDEERSDREMVLAAISHNGNALALASKELKDDYEIVVEVMKNNANAFIYASERLKSIDEIKEKSNLYEYPEDGVNEQLYLNETVWDRGYYEETEAGIWYNLFVTEEIKGYYKTEMAALEALYNFHQLEHSNLSFQYLDWHLSLFLIVICLKFSLVLMKSFCPTI